MRIFIFLLASVFLLSCRAEMVEVEKPLSIGAWRLAPQTSVISFITVKNGTTSEAHNFKTFTGLVSASGEAIITIDLESVETNIDIRNERMIEYLFETDTHRQVSVSTQIDLEALYAMTIGARAQATIPLKIGLHGSVENIDADVFITRIAKRTAVVETRTPIHIDAGDFKLTAGLAKLQSLADLSSITPSVPVSFSLLFEAKPIN